MRFRTLEIRWHDSKPISTCDFQPAPLKRARPPSGVPGGEERYTGHSYRLATGGEDNHVRVCSSSFSFVSSLRSCIGMDGISKHPACVTCQRRTEPCCTPPTTDRISFHTQSAFCSRQCCTIFSQWYIRMLLHASMHWADYAGRWTHCLGWGWYVHPTSKNVIFLRLLVSGYRRDDYHMGPVDKSSPGHLW